MIADILKYFGYKELVEKGAIAEEKALMFADSPTDLRLKLRGFV
ncbi:MAG: hypothetical protein QME78_18140 [Thermodesulfobacteriota bacterium]|nr:hypothetical protein [Thermodesulfobacteriota bacterium]